MKKERFSLSKGIKVLPLHICTAETAWIQAFAAPTFLRPTSFYFVRERLSVCAGRLPRNHRSIWRYLIWIEKPFYKQHIALCCHHGITPLLMTIPLYLPAVPAGRIYSWQSMKYSGHIHSDRRHPIKYSCRYHSCNRFSVWALQLVAVAVASSVAESRQAFAQ